MVKSTPGISKLTIAIVFKIFIFVNVSLTCYLLCFITGETMLQVCLIT